MTLGEYIKKYREEHEMSGRAFAALVGISPQYASNLEKGKNNQGKPLSPSIDIYKKIAKATGVDENAFFGMLSDRIEVTHKPPIRSDVMEQYEALDEHGKEVVKAVLNLEYARCVGAKPKPETKVIPLFTSAFAAGPSGDFAEEAWEDYEVPADTKADFAIRVSGDSMEPELHDGEIYLCKKRYPEIGEIAVAIVNGEFYVKQFITDGKNIFLRSVNRARKDNDIDIWRSGQYTGRCLGTVIHKRIPLVEQ